jgi:hypothetical protein
MNRVRLVESLGLFRSTFTSHLLHFIFHLHLLSFHFIGHSANLDLRRLQGISLNELAAHAWRNTIELFGLSELEDPPAEGTQAGETAAVAQGS